MNDTNNSNNNTTRLIRPRVGVNNQPPRSSTTVATSPSFFNFDLVTLLAVFGWFFFNISIANVNKWIFSHHAFHYPVFVTTMHMVCSLFFSTISIRLGFSSLKPIGSWDKWRRKILPLAAVFCASVAAGNIALRYLFVSYAQMVTATTPLFTVIALRLLTTKSIRWEVYLAMIPIAGGVALSSWQEADLNWLGFFAAIFATALRAVKSVWQGILLSDDDDKFDALSLLYHMSPPSIVMLIAMTLFFEPAILLDWQTISSTLLSNFELVTWIFLSAVIAFFLNIMNFLVTKFTSAITLQVLGNVKVVLSIIVSVLIFQNSVPALSWVGCIITLLGVNWYSVISKS
eukprot:TRINITY_DN6266_c0_g1_i1.p1 TRINITY_DN6266_c0_g1~~TRINITY_DN6266_c0_g1_i1.p1  ORF type:complete len:344 (-),score=159.19 TRINITY_DN6266_c0_g1_i1:62-1093(-)